MLKRYVAENRLQWVGKAWEIRYALRQEQKQRGGEARLKDLLPAGQIVSKRRS
ncbi:Z-ring formation inhibitor MciZ [Cohnella zeiphila]|uniref:Z-ring formation inhibitor MciZ n=1 Tax=Cohnella zeiphila TaxID=2761120 RepID=A0A7X0SKN2_9BACL|nr:Z-ring formation inhibitor MciZ [Cohnella zeiphila]MBB6730470.1 Z-ring formation inhibitor MciZ [Cohnella zeiphila]